MYKLSLYLLFSSLLDKPVGLNGSPYNNNSNKTKLEKYQHNSLSIMHTNMHGPFLCCLLMPS